ncbi:MAG: RHS repeat domain-containing protein [Planctomycetota bacterium]
MDQQTIADYPVGGAATTPTFRYVYASYIDEPVVRKGPTSTSTVHFYHRNHQYSVTAITNSAGAISERYAYTAYGQPTILNASGTPLSPQTSTLNSRYSYTGREWDSTLALHHIRARWMSPSAGRFLGRDPIGYEAGISVYQFLRSRVMVTLDPTGTVDINCHCSCSRQGHGGRVDDSFETDVTVNCLTLPTICCSRACEIERRNRYGDPAIRGCEKSSCTYTWQWGPPLPPFYPEHCSIPDCVHGCNLAAASAYALCRRYLPETVCRILLGPATTKCIVSCFIRCDDPCSWIAPGIQPCLW